MTLIDNTDLTGTVDKEKPPRKGSTEGTEHSQDLALGPLRQTLATLVEVEARGFSGQGQEETISGLVLKPGLKIQMAPFFLRYSALVGGAGTPWHCFQRRSATYLRQLQPLGKQGSGRATRTCICTNREESNQDQQEKLRE